MDAEPELLCPTSLSLVPYCARPDWFGRFFMHRDVVDGVHELFGSILAPRVARFKMHRNGGCVTQFAARMTRIHWNHPVSSHGHKPADEIAGAHRIVW